MVVTQPSLAAHCQHRPNGGKVVALDPETLATVLTLGDWGEYGATIQGQPAFRASPTDDLVLLASSTDHPAVRAVRVSDGAALPITSLATLPAAVLPDGVSAVDAAPDLTEPTRTTGMTGELRIYRLADGSVTARAVTPRLAVTPPSIAISRDGGTVVVAGEGNNLLSWWNVAKPNDTGGIPTGALSQVCSASESPPGSTPTPAASRADAAAPPSSSFNDPGLPPPPTGPTVAVVGTSGDCWVVQKQIAGIFRECAHCEETPFAPQSSHAVLSLDGSLLATTDGRTSTDLPGITVYRFFPERAVMRTFPPRPPVTDWGMMDVPVAISADNTRLLVAAVPTNSACFFGPTLEDRVYDLTSGALLDTLPPDVMWDPYGLTATVNAQVWRAR